MACVIYYIIRYYSVQTGIKVLENQSKQLSLELGTFYFRHGDKQWKVFGKLQCPRAFHGSISFTGIVSPLTFSLLNEITGCSSWMANKQQSAEMISFYLAERRIPHVAENIFHLNQTNPLQLSLECLNILNDQVNTSLVYISNRNISAVLTTYQTHDRASPIPTEHNSSSLPHVTFLLFLVRLL